MFLFYIYSLFSFLLLHSRCLYSFTFLFFVFFCSSLLVAFNIYVSVCVVSKFLMKNIQHAFVIFYYLDFSVFHFIWFRLCVFYAYKRITNVYLNGCALLIYSFLQKRNKKKKRINYFWQTYKHIQQLMQVNLQKRKKERKEQFNERVKVKRRNFVSIFFFGKILR